MSTYCLDQAKVTPRGILFNGNLYSCKMALKSQWFELATYLGEWNISICYEHTSAGMVFLIIDDNQLAEVYSLNNTFEITEEEKQRYQSNLRLLKEKRSSFHSYKVKSLR